MPIGLFTSPFSYFLVFISLLIWSEKSSIQLIVKFDQDVISLMANYINHFNSRLGSLLACFRYECLEQQV